MGELVGYLGVWQDSSHRSGFGSLVQAASEKRYSGYEIRDKSCCSLKLTHSRHQLHRFVSASLDCWIIPNMSSKFANRRKPRKVGGDDEEEDGGAAPGMWATVTFFLP